jgi:site-specific DNA recombinase
MPTMRAACYARFSSDLQRATSLDDQIVVARRYAEQHGWVFLAQHVYTDAAISGASLERPGIQAVRAAASQRPAPFDVLLVDDSSRVSRDLSDAVRLLQELKFFGVRVIYISQNIDSDSDQAETLVAVHGVVDSLYLREMSKKVKRGLAGQLERGFATGSSTFGYRTFPVQDPTGKRDSTGYPALLGKRVEIEPAEARVIRQIFEWFADGLGVRRIVERLNRAGVTGPRGNTWRHGAVKRILVNEKYAGKRIWGQKRFERQPGTDRRVTRAVPRDQWHSAGASRPSNCGTGAMDARTATS